MTPDQLRELIESLRGVGGFNWIQSVMALGAMLVSVTGVVVGMRTAISTLAEQLKVQDEKLDKLFDRMEKVAKELAVMQYAIRMGGGGGRSENP